MNSFLIALTFLTRVPVPFDIHYGSVQMARSVLWYPLVGLLIGCFLVLAALFFLYFGLPSSIVAGLVLGLWIVVTGALHWDGLADCADAWLANGDQEKTLAVLKDTHCGAAAIVVVGVCLLLFSSALTALVIQQNWVVIAFAPVLGRAAALILILTTTYVRENGMGVALTAHIPKLGVTLILVTTAAIIFLLLSYQGLVIIVGLIAMVFMLRCWMQKRLGGMTGDTIGALIVLSELSVMLLSLGAIS